MSVVWELVSESRIIKGVLVTVKTTRDAQLVDNCIHIFSNIIRCVMHTKAEFCHSIRPKFFLLDSPATPSSLDDDHLFAMSDVERVLTSPQRKQWVVSVSGKQRMERSKLDSLLQLSHWNKLFSIDLDSVLSHIEEVVRGLHMLGIYLAIPKSRLEEVEENFPRDVKRQRIELVKVWMNSSHSDYPPCWWHLVQALEKIQHGALAEKIRAQHSKL